MVKSYQIVVTSLSVSLFIPMTPRVFISKSTPNVWDLNFILLPPRMSHKISINIHKYPIKNGKRGMLGRTWLYVRLLWFLGLCSMFVPYL